MRVVWISSPSGSLLPPPPSFAGLSLPLFLFLLMKRNKEGCQPPNRLNMTIMLHCRKPYLENSHIFWHLLRHVSPAWLLPQLCPAFSSRVLFTQISKRPSVPCQGTNDACPAQASESFFTKVKMAWERPPWLWHTPSAMFTGDADSCNVF